MRYIDGLFMGPMFLAHYGSKIADRQSCFGEIEQQFRLFHTQCRKNESGLLYYGWSDDGQSAWADPVTVVHHPYYRLILQTKDPGGILSFQCYA